MTIEELIEQYELRAEAEREEGGSIDIMRNMPWVSIIMSNGDEYTFSGSEADDLLATVPDWIHPETYLLAIAQNW